MRVGLLSKDGAMWCYLIVQCDQEQQCLCLKVVVQKAGKIEESLINDRQADRQTGKQTDRQTDRQVYG